MPRSSSWWSVPTSMTMATGLFMAQSLPVQVQASLADPGLLMGPPMGFNNWARFECDLNETLFTETAQVMVNRGLLDAGYNRLNLDDCWMTHERAADGSLQWNTTLFPHGIPWLAKYAKSHGFHLGIYEDAGNATCGGYPGSLGHEQQDAESFASWGIDYLKLDGCNVFSEDGRPLRDEYRHLYKQWHQILSSMQQPLIFSESAPAYFSTNATDWAMVMDWIPGFGELARHSDDIIVYSGDGSAWDSVMLNYHYHTLVVRYQQPGYFNDPDFLIPDHPGLTDTEKRSQFALWASMGAPLIISAYIPDLSDSEIEFLTNKDLISVDQDSLAEQSALVSRDSNFDVLTRSLANGDRLLTVLNRGNDTTKTKIPISRLGLNPDCKYKARDLLTGAVSTMQDAVEITLDSHATAVLRITPPRKCTTITPTGMILNTATGHCLTATSTGVKFESCQATDSQVWHVASASQGSKLTLTPLSDKSKCLATSNSGVSLASCDGGSRTAWSHYMTGQLQSINGGCLTESDGDGRLGTCSLGQAGQILGLPSGVRLADGTAKK